MCVYSPRCSQTERQTPCAWLTGAAQEGLIICGLFFSFSSWGSKRSSPNLCGVRLSLLDPTVFFGLALGFSGPLSLTPMLFFFRFLLYQRRAAHAHFTSYLPFRALFVRALEMSIGTCNLLYAQRATSSIALVSSLKALHLVSLLVATTFPEVGERRTASSRECVASSSVIRWMHGLTGTVPTPGHGTATPRQS